MLASRFSRVLLSVGFVCLLLLPAASLSNPDPCLIVYTTSLTTYHYCVEEYYTVTAGHPLYDPLYDRGGEVLIDINTDEIGFDVYQAPNLKGFAPTVEGEDGYFSIGTEFDVIIDGWNNEPKIFENIILVFEPETEACILSLSVDDVPVTDGTCSLGDLVVSTPTLDGNYYSDTITKHVIWSGCTSVRIWAFADENYNGQQDGGECFSAFSHDLTVPVESRSWGAIKVLYQE